MLADARLVGPCHRGGQLATPVGGQLGAHTADAAGGVPEGHRVPRDGDAYVGTAP
ncbi:MAG: hypothetical protein WBW80_06355 [Acidimicrobiales bacterium]